MPECGGVVHMLFNLAVFVGVHMLTEFSAALADYGRFLFVGTELSIGTIPCPVSWGGLSRQSLANEQDASN